MAIRCFTSTGAAREGACLCSLAGASDPSASHGANVCDDREARDIGDPSSWQDAEEGDGGATDQVQRHPQHQGQCWGLEMDCVVRRPRWNQSLISQRCRQGISHSLNQSALPDPPGRSSAESRIDINGQQPAMQSTTCFPVCITPATPKLPAYLLCSLTLLLDW